MIQARAIKQLLTFFLLTAFSLVNTVFVSPPVQGQGAIAGTNLTSSNSGIKSISDLTEYNLASPSSPAVSPAVTTPNTISGSSLPEGGGYMGIGYEEELGFEATANFDVQPVGQYVHGLDVSKWQGNITWPQVANDRYRFVFAKATEGWGYTDPKFTTNFAQARAANVFIGPYHFARPDLNANAVNEATWFAQSVMPYMQANYLRPVLDLEVKPANFTWEQLSAWTETFMVSFTAITGVEPIIYINSNYANNLSSYLTKYDIWIAHWRYNLNLVPNTGHWDEWVAWQWSNQGASQGIAGRVDLNVTNENFYKVIITDPALPLGQGFMGASYDENQQPPPAPASYGVQAEEYLHGIDVSNHQNVIQWPLVADDGYTFAIAKATEGWGWDDDYFVDNMQQADAAGVVIGAYHFARPDLNNTAVIEATWFASVVGPYLGEGNIRPVLDLERKGSLSWSQLSTWANDFMVTFENLTGVEPMLYINSYYSNNLDASLNHYDLWIAHWTYNVNQLPNTGRWSNWVLWQWGGTAVAGVEDPIVDRNVSRSNLHDAVIGDTVFWTTDQD